MIFPTHERMKKRQDPTEKLTKTDSNAAPDWFLKERIDQRIGSSYREKEERRRQIDIVLALRNLYIMKNYFNKI